MHLVKHNFYSPLFQSHLDLAHSYWEDLLQQGDLAIDATCGSGNDTLKLMQILHHLGGGRVIAIDIQEEAIRRTRKLLEEGLPLDILPCVHFYTQSHSDFPRTVLKQSVKLIVYNLGYLPRGNKQLTTMAQTTLQSVENALALLCPGGVLSITCYPGHAEGTVEEGALIERVTALAPAVWNVCYHSFPNRVQAPTLLLVQKNQAK